MCLFGFDVGEAVVGDGGNGWFFRKEWLLSRWFVSEGQRKWVWVGMGFWVFWVFWVWVFIEFIL